MPNAEFCVNVERLSEKEFKSNGQDRVEFLIKTNIGEDFNPLVKIASGGEMSRIMLAIKTVLANVDKVSTLVFDEIDTGISGSSANSVGEKIKNISDNYQVICITHQASIAAKGDYNYYIGKKIDGTRTFTFTKKLNDERQ